MNTKLSKEILREIIKAEKIFLGCHRSPDPDSVGSATALHLGLKKIGKESTVISPDNIPLDLRFIPHAEEIEKRDFDKLVFGNKDIFILLDSGSWAMATGKRLYKPPKVKTIAVDHHRTNENFADINLVDAELSSTGELVYLILRDWNIPIEKDIANALLAGIIGDTGSFAYSSVTAQTLDIAKELIQRGADKDEIITNIFRSVDFNEVKFWGEIIRRMEFDKEHKFIWSAVSYDDFCKYDRPTSAKETAASLFAPIVKDSDFGMIMVEEEQGVLSVSLRSRGDFDVSKIAVSLGGGGHKAAAGAKIYDMEFKEAVERVLNVAKSVPQTR